ncbi:MAG: anti-sigma factor antagonist [Terriglobales bacterium]
MALQVEVRRIGDVALLKCNGRIVNGEEAQALQKRVIELMETDRQLVLHLADVSFLDSSGLGLLVRLAGVLRSARGDLKLCSVTRDIAHVLKITNLKQVLETHESEVEAVAAFYEGARQSDSGRATGRKVVCFDDSEDVLALVRELARQAGYAPVTTCNMGDARVLIKATKPALVVLGPGVSEENRRALQSLAPKTPFATLDCTFPTLAPAEATEHVSAALRAATGQS